MGDKKNIFSLSENMANIPEKLVSDWLSLSATSLIKAEAFCERLSQAIIIDINRKTKDQRSRWGYSYSKY